MKFRFRRLVQDHQDRLFSLAVHLLGNAAEAEEVVQDVMIKLWEHLPGLQASQVRPWLLRVTRNACIDLFRRRQYQQSYALAAGAETQAVTVTPADAFEAADLGDRLVTSIQALSEPFRSLVVLREIQGFSYGEISAALDLTEQQVKVYLHRARRKLRLALAVEHDDE